MRGRVPKYPPLWRARVVVWVLLVALLVFPGTGCLTFGPGRCMCPWAAARPLAVRAASVARRVGSLSGQALPPPTDTAAVPSRASVDLLEPRRCESMLGCDRASQTHTEAPGAVAQGAPAAIRCDLSEPNATRSVAA